MVEWEGRMGMERIYEVWGIHEAVELAEAADKLGLKVVLTKTDKQLCGATFDYVTMKGETYSHNSPNGYRVTVYFVEGNQTEQETYNASDYIIELGERVYQLEHPEEFVGKTKRGGETKK